MKMLKDLFFKNKKKIDNKNFNEVSYKFDEIGKIVYEARIKKNISIEELSLISKIPRKSIYAIENNIEKTRPKDPFIRSILFKLEECLSLKKDILVSLLIKEKNEFNDNKAKLLLRKFDLINTWEGNLIYFLLLISCIFVLKRYFISNINIIEIQNIEEKINKDNL